MRARLWTVWTATKNVPAHTAHSLYDCGNAVVPFSAVKWSFSIDKNAQNPRQRHVNVTQT